MRLTSSPPRAAWARTAAAVPLAALAAACFRGTLPARELYRLRPIPPAVAAPARDSVASLLAVEPYGTPGVYARPEIVYRVGETEYGTYPNREWALPLGTMLATVTATSLRQLPGGATRVQEGTATASAHGLVWRGTVREFEEVDRGARVTASVRLEAQLVRASDDSVLWRGSAGAERAVVPPNVMTAVVDSLAAATSAAVADLVRDAGPTLRAASVARPSARTTARLGAGSLP
ncbi:MAG TPA: ABC-type transport auxiliary lipoprotein family protein [Gemmatirosa sp.]